MKRIVTCTFEFSNDLTWVKYIAVYRGELTAKKGSWELLKKRGINVVQSMKLENYPKEVVNITFQDAYSILLERGFMQSTANWE